MTTARARTAVPLFQAPDLAAKAKGSLDKSDLPVEIVEDQGSWLKVRRAMKEGKALEGYVPRSAIVFPPGKEKELFPAITLPNGETIPSVSPSARMVDFNSLLNNGGRPAWIPVETWDLIPAGDQQTVLDKIRAVKTEREDDFSAWQLEVHSHWRREEAVMGEWETFLRGGQDMLTALSDYIYLQPEREDLLVERAAAEDILHWSGLLHRGQDGSQRLWYKVNLFKVDSEADGWITSEALDPYVFPTEEDDPDLPGNADRVFNLGRSVLQAPTDPEVATARANALASHWGAAQFINVVPVTGHPIKSIDGARHYKLCGEFCCAAIAGAKIYDLLRTWMQTKPDTADRVLTEHVGTSSQELIGILKMYGITASTLDPWKNREHLTPSRLRDVIASGKVAITGVKVGNALQGKLDPNEHVDHWAVLEDVLPVGTSGWVRIYNPYLNQEEVYPFETYMACFWKFPFWTWVDNPKKMGKEG